MLRMKDECVASALRKCRRRSVGIPSRQKSVCLRLGRSLLTLLKHDEDSEIVASEWRRWSGDTWGREEAKRNGCIALFAPVGVVFQVVLYEYCILDEQRVSRCPARNP